MHHHSGCGCEHHAKHHGEQEERHEGHSEDCGCGGHEHQGMNRGCCYQGCGCHHQGGMGFHRRFISREEIVSRLEEYLKQLQAEIKGVEERIAEMKKE